MKRDYELDLDLQENRRYKVFIIIWAVAKLFHMAHSNIFTDSPDNILLTISIGVLILKPSSLLRLLLFIALDLCVTLRYMPNVSNHEILYAFGSLTILQALLYNVYRSKTFDINKKDFFKTFAPVLRIELIIFYFYVVFHKLNSDFFIPAYSCATDFYDQENFFNILPTSKNIYLANAFFTVFIEALIPILLCFKKTRKAGIFIGLIFHTIISYNRINRFFDISSAIFASYLVFMDLDFANTFYAQIEKARQFAYKIKRIPFSRKSLVIICLSFTFFLVYVNIFTRLLETHSWYKIWTVWCFSFLYIYIISLWRAGNKQAAETTFKLRHNSFYLIPAFVVLNGLSPYLGFKTDYSFSMFSNLRTEGGVTNHFIMPVTSQIFGYQKDIIEIVSSTHPQIRKHARKKKLLTYFSFNIMVHHFHPERVEYIRNGKHYVYDITKPSEQGDLAEEEPYLLKKILRFREIDNAKNQQCSH